MDLSTAENGTEVINVEQKFADAVQKYETRETSIDEIKYGALTDDLGNSFDVKMFPCSERTATRNGSQVQEYAVSLENRYMTPRAGVTMYDQVWDGYKSVQAYLRIEFTTRTK